MSTPPHIDELADDLDAYGGDFLPGFSEDWVMLERAQLKASFNRKIELLLDLLSNEKRWTEVLKWAERWIALEKNPEAAFRALMIAHASQGDLAGVKQDYERCVQILLEESALEHGFVRPLTNQDSGAQGTLAVVDLLVRLSPHSPALAGGCTVEVLDF